MCEETYVDGPVKIISVSPNSCLCPIDTSTTWISPRHALSVRNWVLSITEYILITTWCCSIVKSSNCLEKTCLHGMLLCHEVVFNLKGRIVYSHQYLWFPSKCHQQRLPALCLTLVWWWLKFRWKWVYMKGMFLIMCIYVTAKALRVIEIKLYQQ